VSLKRPVRARGGLLAAAEIDAPKAFARWLGRHHTALTDIIEHGTWLDREDVDALLGLSVPGIDELVGLIEIFRLAADQYDQVIVDTAPTGHTLRLLDAPNTVAAIARVLDGLYERHRLIRDQLARVGRVEAADVLIERLAGEAGEAGALLKDRRRVSVLWVTLAEEMSVAEAAAGVESLEAWGIDVRGVIVNSTTPAGPACSLCDRRRGNERQIIRHIERRFPRRSVHVVERESREPRGVEALGRIGAALLSTPARRPAREHGALRATARLSSTDAAGVAADVLRLLDDFQLLFVGGKGGVGKTTVAAALALRLARADPRRTVLLLSTDPAHSLHDVFGQPVGDDPVGVDDGPRNLRVREVDAAAALRSRREGLEAALNEIGTVLGAGAAVASGEDSAAGLLDLAPPGMDELFGLLSVLQARREFSHVVIDTAPTGHALRLLETPDAAGDWVRLLLRVLLKYRSLARPGQLASDLVKLSKAIRALRAELRDPRKTAFVVATRAGAVPRLETERLLSRLAGLQLPVRALVVNALTLEPGRCPRCRATWRSERRELARLSGRRLRKRGRCAIIQTPLTAPPPMGPSALERWVESWRLP
jgi:arsenite-transporting ATPase